MGLVIKANGKLKKVTPGDQHFSLNELCETVGGDIEMVSVGEHYDMVLCEEGRLLDYPPNANATLLTRMLVEGTIRGDVFVLAPWEQEDYAERYGTAERPAGVADPGDMTIDQLAQIAAQFAVAKAQRPSALERLMAAAGDKGVFIVDLRSEDEADIGPLPSDEMN